jgi:hypothetical protein
MALGNRYHLRNNIPDLDQRVASTASNLFSPRIQPETRGSLISIYLGNNILGLD